MLDQKQQWTRCFKWRQYKDQLYLNYLEVALHYLFLSPRPLNWGILLLSSFPLVAPARFLEFQLLICLNANHDVGGFPSMQLNTTNFGTLASISASLQTCRLAAAGIISAA